MDIARSLKAVKQVDTTEGYCQEMATSYSGNDS